MTQPHTAEWWAAWVTDASSPADRLLLVRRIRAEALEEAAAALDDVATPGDHATLAYAARMVREMAVKL